jgi:hypothetical protein
MKLDIKFAELHNPLFHAGKNFGTKLDPGKLAGLKLVYDRAEKELLVSWEGRHAILPSTSVSSMEEGLPEKKAVHHTHPIVAGIASAQVETPFGHVHAGVGHGKTGKSK